ncbi:unnamed protein product [Rhizophagus irregularis]|nr:unnamed protein product [Rhizophagus irregularis]CAB4414842.1 unnamed protein product [Rhizophagus irregularis]
MFDFLEERQQLNPKIFVGTGISGVTSGDNKRLLMEWGLMEEASNELCNSVSSIHGVPTFRWPLIRFSMMHNSHAINGTITIGKVGHKCSPHHMKVANANLTNTTRRAFFYATNYQSASKNGIRLRCDLNFGREPSFYLNPSIENAIDWIKDHKGFNGIIVYWVDVDIIKSMRYQDLVSEGDDLWKGVVVASRCSQVSEVDRDDFVYRYQLSNPRQILTEWEDHGGEDVEGSWQNVIPSAQWFEPIRHLQLAIKTPEAIDLMNSYCVGIIYFHTK